MFETLCALLLRIYPAGFRRAYGRDAVQLIRDRARDERGVLLRARLLIDLARDLFMTSLHGWESEKPTLARVDGAPRFDVIDVHGPRPTSLVAGLLTSILVWASFVLLFQPREIPTPTVQFGEGSASDTPGAGSDDASQPAVITDPEARQKLVIAIAGTLKERYVDRAIGQHLADALLRHEVKGEYASLGLDAELAARLNKDIQSTAWAFGLPRGVFVADVVYSAQPLPMGPPPPMTAEMREQNRAVLLRENCLFETIETLPHNIGYIKLNGFADPTICRETTSRAMASLNKAGALIVDLRDNGGGLGDAALQIAGYLFDRPTYMYDPRPHSPVPGQTASPMAGNALADKPVYVLTSSATQSAAEYFVYNLKMLKRATIVGETTAGHQHSGGFFRITDHFGVGIQDAAPPDNPYPVKGWEIIGIEPDVKVSSADALDEARKLAESRITRRPGAR